MLPPIFKRMFVKSKSLPNPQQEKSPARKLKCGDDEFFLQFEPGKVTSICGYWTRLPRFMPDRKMKLVKKLGREILLTPGRLNFRKTWNFGSKKLWPGFSKKR
ncbi:MAG: hypothetical protein QNJ36_17710 [Calothrix sp. MO_167.B42]|nr:hypothetical protein [Calothrix sp. MO_167.B42]